MYDEKVRIQISEVLVAQSSFCQCDDVTKKKKKRKKISFATSPSVEEANCIDVMIWVDPTTNRHSERIEKNNVPCPRGNIRSFQIVVGFKDAHTILYSNIPMYIQS